MEIYFGVAAAFLCCAAVVSGIWGEADVMLFGLVFCLIWPVFVLLAFLGVLYACGAWLRSKWAY